MSEDFDIIVAGGGLVGASTAVALARAGRRVAIIEAQSRQANHQPSHDDRTLVINAASLNILGRLELLPAPSARMPIERIEITRAGGFGHLHLAARDFGRQAFGQVIVARELGNTAIEALASEPMISEFCPARLIDWRTDDEGITVRLDDQRQLRSRLLIGADGNQSGVRETAGLRCQRMPYGQSAMIFNVLPRRRSAATAFERFTPRGPLALLPQPAGRFGVVWIDRDAGIDQAMQLDDDQLCQQLLERFGSGLGRFEQPGTRARYPLVRQRTAWPVSDRVVLVGNAANAVHPVSAQGFNLGLRDVAGLVDVLSKVDDPGDAQALARYARIRQPDQDATVRYTDTLARAFTNPSRLARLATGLGLAAHAGLPGLRARLVQAAMGFRQPVPSLARPLEDAA